VPSVGHEFKFQCHKREREREREREMRYGKRISTKETSEW
jgi:hypothetical protein